MDPTLSPIRRAPEGINFSAPWLYVRIAFVAVTALFMGASVTLLGGMVDGYARHLCGWPATIRCSTGTWMWWLLPISATVVAVVGGLLLVTWALRNRAAYLIGLTHAAWVGSLFFVVMHSAPRTLDLARLVRYGTWGGVGIELLRFGGLLLLPSRRRFVHMMASALWAAYLAMLAALPATLEALEKSLGLSS